MASQIRTSLDAWKRLVLPSFRDLSYPLWVGSVDKAVYPRRAYLPALAAPGGRGQFRPDDYATRLAAAVALVRAAGLQSEVSAASTQPLNLNDASSIPTTLRGYVAVALAHNLLTADDGNFRPQSALTRAELAHAIAVISK